MSALRSSVFEITQQSLSGFAQEWQLRVFAGLGVPHMEHLMPPVDILEAHCHDFSSSKPVGGQQHEDGVVAPPNGREILTGHRKHLVDLFGRKCRRDRLILVDFRHQHDPTQIGPRVSSGMQVAQEQSKIARVVLDSTAPQTRASLPNVGVDIANTQTFKAQSVAAHAERPQKVLRRAGAVGAGERRQAAKFSHPIVILAHDAVLKHFQRCGWRRRYRPAPVHQAQELANRNRPMAAPEVHVARFQSVLFARTQFTPKKVVNMAGVKPLRSKRTFSRGNRESAGRH